MASRHKKPIELWTEADHQAEIVERFSILYPQYDPLLVAVPNQAVFGGGKSAAARQYNALKSVGMKKGASDLLFLVPSPHYNYLALEMKTPEHKNKKHGGLRPEQVRFLLCVQNNGGASAVGYGWEHALFILEDYLSGARFFFESDLLD